jgi:hypothetical protein
MKQAFVLFCGVVSPGVVVAAAAVEVEEPIILVEVVDGGGGGKANMRFTTFITVRVQLSSRGWRW